MSTKRTVTPGGKGKKRAKNDTPANLNRDLNKLRGLAASTLVEMDAEKINVSDLALLNLGRAAKEMTDDEVKDEIETIMVQAAKGILTGNGLEYGVALRAASNQLYIPELDRLVLKDAVSSRPFSNVSSVKKVAISTRVLSLIHEVVSKNIHITKRDLFYTDVKLFTKQSESDAIIEDVATMIGCTRNSLNVVASEKGVVVGRMSFRDDGDLIDCTKMGVGGKVIPGLIDRVSDIKGDAEFVLLVEKDAVFMRLSEDRFYNDYPCIIITAKGQPDIATRLFLKRIRTILKIPILGLMDSDPHGLKILSVYMHGSKNMSYDSEHLTTADIKWLGVRPSDLERYNIPVECRLDMTESDLKTGRELLNEDFVKKNPKWVEELELMNKTKQKAEIQALSSFGFQYLSKTYLPQKLRAGDWI
ncbi:DNA topoisomerase 6 subunit A [Sphaeroforma arctica JP610]|uniref:DNA topoisomerase (ATP-hydrolyzing) n=1 Tax=Sphaeroforma arctica JP610 TaxID=667725 RepID=A0A0L0G8C4_9EUKA|nr:DNA topoisomerase 6 subunit A [Sphaeroforma arctica JP610]KNC85250.1 DNA topoisomerase 6 subunit A [Sphaeroforma arctica JP610]|eukprot:XP_014159152.1 DNA topoisomerase 6 subunit A [Sphaeroforma arctica JP610]